MPGTRSGDDIIVDFNEPPNGQPRGTQERTPASDREAQSGEGLGESHKYRHQEENTPHHKCGSVSFDPDRTGISGSNSISILGKPSFRDVMLLNKPGKTELALKENASE